MIAEFAEEIVPVAQIAMEFLTDLQYLMLAVSVMEMAHLVRDR